MPSTSWSGFTPTKPAASASTSSSWRSRSIVAVPVIASMRRRFDPIEPSDTTLIGPMSPSAFTCVPPHSSSECGPASSTRTTSPYLSPKNAIAPERLRLGLRRLVRARTRGFASTSWFARSSIRAISSGGDRRVVAEVEAQAGRARRASPPASREGRAPRATPSAAGACRCGCDGSRRGARRRCSRPPPVRARSRLGRSRATWRRRPGSALVVSDTSARPVSVRIVPVSPIWPPLSA